MEDLWRNWRSVRYVKKVWVWKWPNKAPRTMEGGNWKIYGVDWDRNGDFAWEEQTFAIKSLNKPISKIPLQFFPISAAPLCHVCSGWVIARQFRAQLPSTEPLPWAGWRLRNTELIDPDFPMNTGEERMRCWQGWRAVGPWRREGLLRQKSGWLKGKVVNKSRWHGQKIQSSRFGLPQ